MYLASSSLLFPAISLFARRFISRTIGQFLVLAAALANIATAVGCTTPTLLFLRASKRRKVVVVADLGASGDVLRGKDSDTHLAIQVPLFDLTVGRAAVDR